MAGQALVPHFEAPDAVVYHGDCIDVLPQLEANSVDAVVTSPPYAMQRASTYGGIPEEDYPDWALEVFTAIEHVLKPRGSILWNISPHVRGGQLTDYMLHTRLKLRAAGWFEHDELVWVKPDKMPTGRPNWPVRAWESLHWFSRTPNPFADATRNGNYITDKDRKAVARRRAPFRGRDSRLGWTHLGEGVGKMGEFSRGKNFVSVAVRSNTNEFDHPAPFPLELARWAMRFITPAGGTVLDPFAGSGTTTQAAMLEGARSIAVEREEEYLPLIVQRILRRDDPVEAIRQAGGDLGLFELDGEAL